MAHRPPRGDVRSVWIGDVRPELDGGQFPVKREVGDTLEVTADILQEGHGGLAAVLRYRTVKDTAWHEVAMEPLGNDRWCGRFPLEENTRYVYTIGARRSCGKRWRASWEPTVVGWRPDSPSSRRRATPTAARGSSSTRRSGRSW